MNQQITGPGALLSSAWRLFKANWKILVFIAVLPYVVSDVGVLLNSMHQVIPAVIGGIASLLAAVCSIAMAPALVNAIHRLTTEQGAQLTFRGQYRAGFGLFWSVVLVGIINGLVFFGSFFLLVIPAIVIGIYGCLYIYTLVIDGKKGFSALTESYSLVKGRWWPVLGRMLFLGLVALVAWLILAGIAAVLGLVFGVHAREAAGALPIGALIVGLIVNLIGASFIVPVLVSYMYGLFASLKATRTPNVDTGIFKKWLVAFIVVGVLAIIVSVVGGLKILSNTVRSGLQSTSALPQNLKIIQSNGPGGAGPGPVQY